MDVLVATPTLWIAFTAFVTAALAVDFLVMRHQGAHRISMREAAIWSLVWVAVSFAFVAGMWWYLAAGGGADARTLADAKALEFITGYLIEKALAVDNIFVFLLVFTYFRVPAEFQKRVLMLGILGALALRMLMILAGAWLTARFHWILYVFGAFLVYTGIRMWISSDDEPDLENNRLLQWLQRRLRVAPVFDGERFVTVIDGVRMLTPLALVIMVLGVVDVVFAVDSIPAIFAITLDPFIVLTSNVFAVLGLRALYFLVAAMHDRFHLLSYGLAIVLLLIGAKMLLMDVVHVPVAWSLAATLAVLVGSIGLSLVVPPRGGGTGAYPFKPKPPPDGR